MNYNFIAPYYHSLSQLFFFNRQHQAHFLILKHLKDGDKILWIGGGAGKFISALEQHNLKLEIDYIDLGLTSSPILDGLNMGIFQRLVISNSESREEDQLISHRKRFAKARFMNIYKIIIIA